MAVNAPALLRELDDNWRAMGKSEGSGVLRACSMTLIVVVRGDRDAQELGATLAEIMHQHPNRTIVFRVTEGGEVDARVSIQCWMPFGRGQQICCEQVEISAPCVALHAVPPAVLGLMVADLPVALWCSDVGLASLPELQPILRLAGKVMVDSSRAADLGPVLPALRALRSGPYLLADLTWARLTRWREALVQLAKSEGWLRPDRLEICYAGEGVPSSAAYLAAWLNAEHLVMRCTAVEMPAAGLGRIRAVRIVAGGREVILRREGTGVGIEVEQLRTGMIFPVLTDSALLDEELGVFSRDEQFEIAFGRIAEVLAS